MKKSYLSLFLVAVLIAVSLACGLPSQSAKPQASPAPVATRKPGPVTVSAQGIVVPERQARLAFKVGGRLPTLAVKVGSEVKAGDVLAKVEATDLENALAQAKAAQVVAEAGLPAAQAHLAAAQAQLDKLNALPDAEALAVAQATLAKAEAGLKDAQAEYDRVADQPFIGMLPQSQNLHLATLDYQVAKARYAQAQKGASADDWRAAKANVAAAEADVALAKARIEQARLSVVQAERALAGAVLTAPFAGTVTQVLANQGEILAPGQALIVLADLTRLLVETNDLEERGVVNIAVGQEATVKVDALAKDLKGRVVLMAPQATLSGGEANYTVTIELTETDPRLRWGMTASVSIIVGK
jgi:multidrug resistance efflux pump